MSTIFEFQVLFRGFVELHGKHEQERAVSGLSSIDSLILSRGSPIATAELEEEFNYVWDAGYEGLFCYFGHVLSNAYVTGSLSHKVWANIWRDAQEFRLQQLGYLDQDMTRVRHIDYCNNGEEDVRRSLKAGRKEYQNKHQVIVLEAPLVIKVNESHELTLSSSNEYFASWLANADSNFLYEKLIRTVFHALEVCSESIAKVHTGALRISGPSSPEAAADSKSGTDSELSFEKHDAGIISCDCALMPSALLGRNTYKFGLGHGLRPGLRHGQRQSIIDLFTDTIFGRNGLVSESRSLSLPERIFDNGKGLVFVIGHELYLDMMSRFDLSRYEDFLGREREDGPQLEALELFLERVPNCVFMEKVPKCVFMVLWPEKDYCAIKPADEDDDNSVTLLHDLEEDTDAAASGDDTRTCSSAGVLYRWWPLPEGKSSDRSWPRKVGFVMASADRMAQDIKSLYKVQCQKDGRERDRQKEYWYLRFVKNPERNIMVLDYTHTKAMLFSPECLECSWQDNSVKLPLLFGYEMELVDMVNLPSVEFNDVQSLVAIAHAVPLDYLPDSSVRIPADLLDHFYKGYYPDSFGIGLEYGPSPGFTQQGAQRLVDRLALETKYDLLDLNKYLKKFALKATISPDSFDDEMRLVFLQMRYSREKYLDQLMMRGFEWINDVIDFCKSFRHSGLTSKLLSHRGLACINNLELLICQAVYDFPVLRKLFDSESWVKEARDLRKLFSCVLSRHENSPEFRSLISCSWCRPDQEMLHLMRADSNAVSFDEPVAVVDAEFLMGNFRNIRKAAGNRTIVIPLTVLNALSVCRGHFDLPLKLISSHAQRAVIKLGDKAVYYVPDFNFTSMVARAGQKNQNTEPDEASEGCDVSITDIYSAFMTADDDSEDNDLDSEDNDLDCDAGSEEDSQDSSICSYSCISTAICLQAYDTVLYTGNEETARKAEQLGVKTVLSDAVTGAYRKQAKLINKLVTQDQSNAEELSCNEDVGYASTYDISMSLIDNAMKDLSWKHCYDTGVMGSMDLSEKHAKAVLDLQLKLLTEADRASYLLNLYSHNPGIYHDFVRMASRPGTDSVYREQLLGLRRGRTAAARLMTDERTLITAEDMKVQIDHFMDWYESSEEQSEGGDS